MSLDSDDIFQSAVEESQSSKEVTSVAHPGFDDIQDDEMFAPESNKENSLLKSDGDIFDKSDDLFGTPPVSSSIPANGPATLDLSDPVDINAVESSDSPKKKETPTPTVTLGTSSHSASQDVNNETTEEPPKILIEVTEPHKVGDGIGAYVVYKVTTKTSLPAYRKKEFSVNRRFSDFLGMREKLVGKYISKGFILPPAPEKSVVGMTKVKMSKEEISIDFIEKRRCRLARFMNRLAGLQTIQEDPDFRTFLEHDGDLPKATNTQAISSASFVKFFGKMSDSFAKINQTFEEEDQVFLESKKHIDELEQQLRRVTSSADSLSSHRKDLAISISCLSKSVSQVGATEQHTSLHSAFAKLSETYDHLHDVVSRQAVDDVFIMSEVIKDYLGIIGSIKDVFNERARLYRVWKIAESDLTRKRESKVQLELAKKTEKASAMQQEISELENRVDTTQLDFNRISETLMKEITRFDKTRASDFKKMSILYMESLLKTQEESIVLWEGFLPEAKSIA